MTLRYCTPLFRGGQKGFCQKRLRRNQPKQALAGAQRCGRTFIDKLGSSLNLLEDIQARFGGGNAWAQPGPGPGPRPKGQDGDRISSSKSVLNMSPSKLRLDSSLPIKILPHPCSSQTLFRPVSPEPLLTEPLTVVYVFRWFARGCPISLRRLDLSIWSHGG